MSEGLKSGDPGREKVVNSTEIKPEESVLLERSIELSALKSRLISVMAHDLRTPLTGIFTSTEILGLNPRISGEPALQKYLHRILQSVKGMDMMIKNISVVDKSTRGGIASSVQKFHMEDLIEEVQENTALLLREGMRFNVETAVSSGSFTGDRSLIKDTLERLIDNAIKFSEEGGEVLLKIEKEAGYFTFSVIDGGRGIAGEDVEGLFGLLVTGRHQGHGQGAGLGLYVARHMAELLGGEVRLEQNERGGCSAIFKVPIDSAVKESTPYGKD